MLWYDLKPVPEQMKKFWKISTSYNWNYQNIAASWVSINVYDIYTRIQASLTALEFWISYSLFRPAFHNCKDANVSQFQTLQCYCWRMLRVKTIPHRTLYCWDPYNQQHRHTNTQTTPRLRHRYTSRPTRMRNQNESRNYLNYLIFFVLDSRNCMIRWNGSWCKVVENGLKHWKQREEIVPRNHTKKWWSFLKFDSNKKKSCEDV